jgi:hypothetical protein
MFPTDPDHTELLAALTQAFPATTPPDRAAAAWWFAARNHERGGSALRDALRVSAYRPAWGQHAPDHAGPIMAMVAELEFRHRGALLRYG